MWCMATREKFLAACAAGNAAEADRLLDLMMDETHALWSSDEVCAQENRAVARAAR